MTPMRRFIRAFSEAHPLPPLAGPFYPHTIRHDLGDRRIQTKVRRHNGDWEMRLAWVESPDEILIDLPAGRWDVAIKVDGKPPHIETITVP